MNPNEDTRIEHGAAVSLHFSVALENGIEIDNSRSQPAPVSLTIGDGNLLPGFEAVLLGLRAGDRRTAVLSAADAFGEWHADNVQQIDTVKFDPRPVVGTVVEFEDKAKNTLPGVVKAVNDVVTEVDFNHPLAGKTVVFEIEIFKVTPAGQAAVVLR